ncbi:MAG: ASCH domain-containing protein [Mariprofundus sp.]
MWRLQGKQWTSSSHISDSSGMNHYPEKTCDISSLVRHPKLVEAAIAGIKTRQGRDGVYAYPEETFELDGIAFIVTSLRRQTLGEMTDADAQAEGYPDLAAYKDLILRMHKGMTWNLDARVWVHSFRRLDAVATASDSTAQ